MSRWPTEGKTKEQVKKEIRDFFMAGDVLAEELDIIIGAIKRMEKAAQNPFLQVDLRPLRNQAHIMLSQINKTRYAK